MMRTSPNHLLGLCAAAGMLLSATAKGSTMRPHIFVTVEKTDGLRSLAEVRDAIKSGHAIEVWERVLQRAEADLKREPLLPSTSLPGRGGASIKRGNPDWQLCHQAGQRVLCAALACLITGDTRYRDESLRQMAVLFDEEQWPQWRDMAHRPPADLRTGMLSQDLAIAYDWLHPHLSDEQRQWIVDGIDRRGIQPFWQAVDVKMGWVNGRNNWTTCIVGGLGIAGMALGDAHPDAQRLVEFSLPRMERYLEGYGRDGEFNESVGYAGATRLVAGYFMAYWYATGGKENRLAQHPFPQTARWHAYSILPPGRFAAFGDAHRGAKADLTYFAPIAAASRDGVLQWFYNNYPSRSSSVDLVRQLLCFDDSVPAETPEGRLPRGRAFRQHGAIIASRSSWDPKAAAIVVYGKAGVERYHQHHDAGHVCIDGYGRELIVDLGSPPGYPKDYGEPTRYKYYNASSLGHNVLTVGGREMSVKKGQIAPIIAAEFDDARGGYWQLDLTKLYNRARAVRRTVVHLNPNVAVVLDEARLTDPEEISLRWHTADRCDPNADGSFMVENKGVRLAALVVRLDEGGVTVARGEHEYRAPYDHYRLGSLLKQRRESFVEARAKGEASRLLTLFATFGLDEEASEWVQREGEWELSAGPQRVRVRATRDRLTVANDASGATWDVDLRQRP